MAAAVASARLTEERIREIVAQELDNATLDVNDDDVAEIVRKELKGFAPSAPAPIDTAAIRREAAAAAKQAAAEAVAALPKQETAATAEDVARINRQLKNVAEALGKFTPETVAALEAKLDQTRRELADVATLAASRPATEAAPSVAGMDAEAVKDLIRAALKGFRPKPPPIEVKLPSSEIREVKGKAHACLAEVLQLAAARKNIFLVGPAGSGKTYLPAQVAEALALPFYFLSCTAGMSEGHLGGRLLPIGEGGRFCYSISQFVQAYQHGGVCLLDEGDAADGNSLLFINSALANGHMAVPNRPEEPVAKRHPDFICIMAGNTFGHGADRMYVGRSQLDESTLDRFRIGTIEMDYDPELEAALCPDGQLRTRLQQYRERCNAARLRRIISSRFMRDAYEMSTVGWTVERIEKALFSGWTKEERQKVGAA